LLNSMTGFGRSEVITPDRKIAVEVKSVNHRYCDISIKMPRKLSMFEPAIRTLVQEYVERGKIDIFITYEEYTGSGSAVRYNKALAADYLHALQQMKEDFGFQDTVRLTELSRYPDVLTLEETAIDENEVFKVMEKALREALEALTKARSVEGGKLRDDLLGKLDVMDGYVAEIEKAAPGIVANYRQKLEQRVKELLDDTEIDESRIAMETTIYADKLCVDEEIVRLKSHISSARQALQEGGAVGRKLDFLAQEMNREANTILSKSGDLVTTDTAISLKTDIEKVREQIQNIE
jgi:uncharacterized protein (TIGR00255 family)